MRAYVTYYHHSQFCLVAAFHIDMQLLPPTLTLLWYVDSIKLLSKYIETQVSVNPFFSNKNCNSKLLCTKKPSVHTILCDFIVKRTFVIVFSIPYCFKCLFIFHFHNFQPSADNILNGKLILQSVLFRVLSKRKALKILMCVALAIRGPLFLRISVFLDF